MNARRNPAITSRIMSKIKSKNTKAELALGRAMWSLGLRYRKHYKLIGKPDFVFISAKVAIFCDGDFWHGRDFIRMVENGRFDNNPNYWIPKMTKTLERDKRVTSELQQMGWVVFRFWETDIFKDPVKIAQEMLSAVRIRTGK